ncbi:MAG: AI-2E family transporter [Desulfobacteraceae bacterium]|nr:AI-2E family transporter [Desulfobacteraceae bacterium]
MNRDLIHRSFLLILVLFISIIFIFMIRPFLMALLLAGIFSSLAQPIYNRLNSIVGGRRQVASALTLVLIIMVIFLPLTGLLGVVTSQAIKVGQSVRPWVEAQLASPDAFSQWLGKLPFYETILPYKETLIKKAGQLVGGVTSFLVNGLQAATMGTVHFLFMLFLLFYAIFYFLVDGHKLLEKILFYLPLEDADERRMLKRFTSVSRATLKGTAVIGVLQGGLAGCAFAVVNIPSAVFWATVMTVLSIIPGVGTALVWGPAVILLAAKGYWGEAIGLTVFCGIVVGSLDNFLRPRLVGKDTQMHDLMILFSTLGGISLFGVIGFIIGPIVAALFVTVWEIYGVVFKDVLPDVLPLFSQSEQDIPAPEPESEDES